MSSLSLLGSSLLSLMNTALPSPVDLPRAFCSHSHCFCTKNRQEPGMWNACWKRDRSSICFAVNDSHSQAPSLISELLDAEGAGLLHPSVCLKTASRWQEQGFERVLEGDKPALSLFHRRHCEITTEPSPGVLLGKSTVYAQSMLLSNLYS